MYGSVAGAKILAPSYRIMAGFSQVAVSGGLTAVSFLSSSHVWTPFLLASGRRLIRTSFSMSSVIALAIDRLINFLTSFVHIFYFYNFPHYSYQEELR